MAAVTKLGDILERSLNAGTVSGVERQVVDGLEAAFPGTFSAFYRYDDVENVFRPSISSVSLASNSDELPVINLESIGWTAFAGQESLVTAVPEFDAIFAEDVVPSETVCVPVPEYGLLVVGSLDGTPPNEQLVRFVEILARVARVGIQDSSWNTVSRTSSNNSTPITSTQPAISAS